MKLQFIILCFIIIVLTASSCVKNNELDNYESAQSVDYEYFKRNISFENSSTYKISGIFDLKSPCLNLNSKEKVAHPLCQMFLAENGGTNADSIETLLKFCNNRIRVNCIEPLPDNAPPEVIKILDKNSEVIEPWSKVVVILRVNRKEQVNDVEVLQIESIKWHLFFFPYFD